MQLRVRMEQAERAVLGGAVISEHQVQLKLPIAESRDRGDRVVRFSVCLRINIRIRICVSAPCSQDLICKIDQPLFLLPTDPDHGHRPFYDPGFHILESIDCKTLFHRRLRHCKGISSALEMIVGQDGTADDREIRIGSQEIVREHRDEIK